MATRRCEIRGCHSDNRDKQGKRFFTFPKDEHVKTKWDAVCRNSGNKHRFVCQDHFDEQSFSLSDRLLNTPMSKRLLVHGAVPTLNLDEPVSPDVSAVEQERVRRKLIADALTEYDRRQEEEAALQAALEVAAAPIATEITCDDENEVFVVEYVTQTQ